ncbi:hypothetical protein LZ32DRAFT_606102 [Colletotrichum eremochloae]|nr:hypothetical protein LZ32DRAFT_606102 [Colletotrichum eremochloae]
MSCKIWDPHTLSVPTSPHLSRVWLDGTRGIEAKDHYALLNKQTAAGNSTHPSVPPVGNSLKRSPHFSNSSDAASRSWHSHHKRECVSGAGKLGLDNKMRRSGRVERKEAKKRYDMQARTWGELQGPIPCSQPLVCDDSKRGIRNRLEVRGAILAARQKGTTRTGKRRKA